MKKIIFIPYKASMWDSLESIWIAAKEDPDCDVKVVVIPYYNKNSDGSLGELRYEGGLMPEYVPVTHYEEVDLSEEKPDVIYIHNPYDMGNNATTVDPAYYSRELKKCCNKLVYVPYYVSIHGMGDAQALCFAYIYADYIIAQSEYMVSCFDETVPRRKIIPLGSPKLDRVIKLCKEGRELPETWKMAEGKRIYFYNTSLNELLVRPNAYLKKMRYVFECFKCSDNACILWRPHPLFEQTIRSMAPECFEEYLKLREWYISEQIGIYDDSPDMDTALAISDVYIGDSNTSLTALFGVAGKPMFLLDSYYFKQYEREIPDRLIINRDWYNSFNPSWAIVAGYLLFKAEKNYEYHYLCTLSEEHYSPALYSNLWEYKGKAFLTSYYRQEILIVGESGVERRIELKEYFGKKGCFRESYLVGSFLFLVPTNYPSLVIYDIENDTLDYIDEYGSNNNGGASVMNDSFVLASRDGSELFVVNTASGDVYKNSTGLVMEEGCRGIIFNQGELWLLSADKKYMHRIDTQSGTVFTYSDLPKDYAGLIFSDGKAVIYDPYCNLSLELNRDTGDTYRTENVYPEGMPKLDLDEVRRHIPGFARQNESIHYACMENYFNDLRDFIENGPEAFGFDKGNQLKAFSKIAENIDGSCGEKIHRFIIGELERR